MNIGDKVTFEMPGVTYTAEVIEINGSMIKVRLEDGYEIEFGEDRLTKVG